MRSISKQSVKDQVYEIIKTKILTQEYKLGEKINMLALEQELNVSNSPIREALSRLEQDGLIVFATNSGPRVMDITENVFRQIVETTRILLCGAYDMCVEKGITDELVAVMEEKLQVQRKHLKDSDFIFADVTIKFDMCFLELLKNDTLESLCGPLSNKLFLIVLYDHQNYDIDREANIREHEMILDAIRKREHALVKDRLRFHYSRIVDFN